MSAPSKKDRLALLEKKLGQKAPKVANPSAPASGTGTPGPSISKDVFKAKDQPQQPQSDSPSLGKQQQQKDWKPQQIDRKNSGAQASTPTSSAAAFTSKYLPATAETAANVPSILSGKRKFPFGDGNNSNTSGGGREGAFGQASTILGQPPYHPLPPSIIEGPIGLQLGLGGAGASADKKRTYWDGLVEELMTKAGARPQDIRQALGAKIGERQMLLDNPAPSKPATASEPPRKYSKKLMSRKELKSKGLLPDLLSPSLVSWSVCMQLHEAWRGYVKQTLAGVTPVGSKEWTDRLRDLAMPGCWLRVQTCRQPRLVGVEGVVVMDNGVDTLHVAVRNGANDESVRILHVPLGGTTVIYALPPGIVSAGGGQNQGGRGSGGINQLSSGTVLVNGEALKAWRAVTGSRMLGAARHNSLKTGAAGVGGANCIVYTR